MQQVFSSDLILVVFSLLLGGLIGMFWERARGNRPPDPDGNDRDRLDRR